ncbi:MAG: peptidoglycan DD-metalloendopeptidase family protein [Bacteroidales bacterium]|nr:peptidoglycan DD-metalloendopeptidase family protein [Bacteroidales bacterium]
MVNKKEKKRSFWRKLMRKYRLVILNEESYEEIGFIRLSRMNIMAIAGILTLILIALVYVAIAYTPVRELIPGYPDAMMSHHIRQNAMKLDSLQRELAMRDQYFLNINRIVSGQRPEDYLNDTSTTRGVDEINFVRSANDSALRQKVEEEEQFRLSISDRLAEGKELHDVHFFTPVSGIITNPFNPVENHYGIDLVAGPNEVVKATLDGTVTMATWTLETGYVIQIQHDNNIMSVYKHNAELFKSVGLKVSAGDVIAIIGNSGELTTGPHLHFELWHNGVPLNPADYIVF